MLTKLKKYATLYTGKYIIKGEEYMGKIRHLLAIFLCCVLFLTSNAAQAMWPVLDFGEVIPLFSKVKEALKTLSQMSGQLGNMSSTLKAVGDQIDPLAKFSQSFSITNLSDIAGDAEDAETDSSVNGKQISENYAKANDIVWSGCLSVISDLIADMAQNRSQQSDSYSFNFYTRHDTALLKMAYAVEPTKEKTDSVFDSEQDTGAKFSAVEEELNILNEKMNDLFDASISRLNQNTEKSLQAMKKLKEELQRSTDIRPKEKDAYLKRVEELINRRQNVGDRLVAIAESTKDNFNSEFQNVVLDGLSNYRKTVERYNRGDAAKEELTKEGEKLREAVATIDTSPDKNVLSALYTEADTIGKDMSVLAADIKNSENAGDDDDEDSE